MEARPELCQLWIARTASPPPKFLLPRPDLFLPSPAFSILGTGKKNSPICRAKWDKGDLDHLGLHWAFLRVKRVNISSDLQSIWHNSEKLGPQTLLGSQHSTERVNSWEGRRLLFSPRVLSLPSILVTQNAWSRSHKVRGLRPLWGLPKTHSLLQV